MVEVGELEIIGTVDESAIVDGLDRIGNSLDNIENQFNQVQPSAKNVEKTLGGIAKSFITIAGIGVGAMTALAIKAPVLANTMAKMEVNTLKLSNTLGRQLRPVFEEIATGLIPAINNAFITNQDAIGQSVERTVSFVKALEDLIDLDFSSLINNLDDVFEPRIFKDIPEAEGMAEEKFGVFAESAARISSGFKQPTSLLESLTGSEGGFLSGPPGMNVALAGITGLIDLFQLIFGTNNNKDNELALVTGVPR